MLFFFLIACLKPVCLVKKLFMKHWHTEKNLYGRGFMRIYDDQKLNKLRHNKLHNLMGCECSVLSGGSGRDLFALARQHRFDEQQRIGSDGCQSSRFAEWKPTLPFTEQHSWRAQRHPRAPRHQRSQQPRLLPTHPLVSYNFYTYRIFRKLLSKVAYKSA